MGMIENLTKTHIDLDVELGRFRRLLVELRDPEERQAAIAKLKAELDAIDRRLELHIESEATLEKRSDRVLGDGSMSEYNVAAHHDNLRGSVAALLKTVGDSTRLDELEAQFTTFLQHFEDYTRSEWEFLQANSSVLYPGGAID